MHIWFWVGRKLFFQFLFVLLPCLVKRTRLVEIGFLQDPAFAVYLCKAVASLVLTWCKYASFRWHIGHLKRKATLLRHRHRCS